MQEESIRVRRRHLLGGLAGGTLLAACAPLAPRPPFTLPRADVSEDRVTRVLVGLRPYRPAGYVVRVDVMGDKRIVHNYGHGGAGITMSWGSSQQAVEAGFEGPARAYAVIGCGVMGLTTAVMLQQRGGTVTIYTKAMPPDTTSNVAGGHFSPSTLYDSRATPQFVEQFHRDLRVSHRHFLEVAGRRPGIYQRRTFVVADHEIRMGARFDAIHDIMPDHTILKPGEHPFGRAWVERFTSIMIEPPAYLASLVAEFVAHAGRIEPRDFREPGEVLALPETTIFNCTGLGARALFGDEEMTPVRGQVALLPPQPEIDYNVLSHGAHMFPRSDGILLGGTFDRGNWDLTPDPEITARIVAGNARIMARLAG